MRFMKNIKNVVSFTVHDSVTNLSYHLPLIAVFECPTSSSNDCCDNQPTVKRLRWDHADISSYYHSTGLYLQSILSDLSKFELGSDSNDSRDASQFF